MKPQQSLQTIGLSDKESAIYLACLELGQTSITNIAKKAKVKRPTTYLILDTLIEKGLVNTSTKGKRTVYGAEDPNKLTSVIAEKSRALNNALPFLNALNNKSSVKPKIRFYEGIEGIKNMYNEIYSSDKIRWWGSIEETNEYLEEIINFWFTKNSKKIKVFDLLTDNRSNREFAKKVVRPGYELRFFPKELAPTIDSALFENKLAMISMIPEPHGLFIESEPIVQSFEALWKLAWQGAIKYKNNSA